MSAAFGGQSKVKVLANRLAKAGPDSWRAPSRIAELKKLGLTESQIEQVIKDGGWTGEDAAALADAGWYMRRITQFSADAFNKLIPQLKASTTLPATVWIERDAPHQLVQATVDQSEGNSIQLTLSEWDKPVTVTKPEV
jgi:hypothetical protein